MRASTYTRASRRRTANTDATVHFSSRPDLWAELQNSIDVGASAQASADPRRRFRSPFSRLTRASSRRRLV